MSHAALAPLFEGWTRLHRRQRRERRFERRLSPPGVGFASDEARRESGTPADVREYVTRLLDSCATDGGFVLRNGAVLDDAKAENLKTMIDVGRGWPGPAATRGRKGGTRRGDSEE